MPRERQTRIDFLNFTKTIFSFEGDNAFLDANYRTEFSYMGDKWNSVQEAYNILSSNLKTPKEKINLMGNILYYRFRNNTDEENLRALKDQWISLNVTNCDNFWHSCTCGDCFFETGNNYYGRLLMEVRDRLIWEHKPNAINKKRWKVRYF